MRLRAEQLGEQLGRRLGPLYFIHGDEPLLVQEAADAVRAAARGQGYDERQVMEAATGFDWEALRHLGDNLSLFAQRRLVELRLPGAKPGVAGAKVLAEVAARPPADTVLLITSGKLDKATAATAWVKAIEHHGISVPVWPIPTARLTGWLAARTRAKGLRLTPGAAALIAARTEGNLLAAVQEIEKLWLLYGETAVDECEAAAAVAQGARFDVYGLADAALAGDAARTAQIIQVLQGEGVDLTLALWALVRDIRTLAQAAAARAGGASLDGVLARFRVWDQRKPLFKTALQRGTATRWRALLLRAARVDKVLKGRRAGSAWDELLQLGLAMAGVETVPAHAP